VTPDPAPLTSEHLTCPFATDAWLRTESPVHHVAEENVWLVTRYDDIQEALRHPERFSNRFGRVIRSRDRLTPDALRILGEGWEPVDTLFTTDPPEHRRFRGLVNKAFTARRVAGMGGYIREVTDALLDDLLTHDGPMDLVDRFAIPLPLTVIADQLGVPRQDLSLFKRWSQAVVAELSRLATPRSRSSPPGTTSSSSGTSTPGSRSGGRNPRTTSSAIWSMREPTRRESARSTIASS
jgi:cytochrome P450